VIALPIEETINPADVETDGRILRSKRSRQIVADAMLELLNEGVLRPTARQVAERAGVSERAVFRHFQQVDALFEAVCQSQVERISRIAPPRVDAATGIAERIDGLVYRWSEVNEKVSPVRRAALLCEPDSPVISKCHGWMRSLLATEIRELFAGDLRDLSREQREDVLAAAGAALSWSTWEHLRRRRCIGRTRARRIVAMNLTAQLRFAGVSWD